MKTFTEALRYEYPLHRGSVVMDLGAYEGNFSKIIGEKYGCMLYAFEPVTVYYDKIAARQIPRINLFNYAIGGSTREEFIGVHGDSSTVFSGSDNKQAIKIRDMKSVLADLNLTHVDLIKINVEGCEYEILDHMIAENLIPLFDNLQIQFHLQHFPDAIERRNNIIVELAKTHELTYHCPFIWENWKRA